MVRKSSQIQTFSNEHKDTFSDTFESDDNWFADVRTLHSIESDLSHCQWFIGNGKNIWMNADYFALFHASRPIEIAQ